jgi:hypothetical protein
LFSRQNFVNKQNKLSWSRFWKALLPFTVHNILRKSIRKMSRL